MSSNHIERMRQEANTLLDNINKAEAFVSSADSSFLDPQQVIALCAQVAAMRAYHCILLVRISYDLSVNG